jgi:hypothetical protein
MRPICGKFKAMARGHPAREEFARSGVVQNYRFHSHEEGRPTLLADLFHGSKSWRAAERMAATEGRVAA